MVSSICLTKIGWLLGRRAVFGVRPGSCRVLMLGVVCSIRLRGVTMVRGFWVRFRCCRYCSRARLSATVYRRLSSVSVARVVVWTAVNACSEPRF